MGASQMGWSGVGAYLVVEVVGGGERTGGSDYTQGLAACIHNNGPGRYDRGRYDIIG